MTKYRKPQDSPLNVWLDVVDNLLEQKMPMTNAMIYAAQKLNEKQKEHRGLLFDQKELIMATDDMKYLLKRRPEYAKEQTDKIN